MLSISAVAFVLSCGVETDRPSQPIPIADYVQPNSTCPEGFIERDPVDADTLAAFPVCCDGSAHLLPDFLIPETFHDRLQAGPEGSLCVPDIFVLTPNHTPASCRSLFGLPGVCLSSCLPEVQNAEIPLPTDVCPRGERCAPCLDPRTEEPTGACDMGALACDPPAHMPTCRDYAFDEGMLANFASCCSEGRAHCAPREMVLSAENSTDADGAAQRLAEELAPCGENDQSFCVPDAFLARAGRFHPLFCRSLGGREGRCLSVCIPRVADEMDTLPQSECASDERCVPCYDPRTGESTRVCSLGRCDEPREPPQLFAPCGKGEDDAFCIPAELIPSQDRSQFDNVGCGKGCSEPGTLCVPRKIIDQGPTYSPAKCKSKLAGFLGGAISLLNLNFSKMSKFSQGRCLSTCIPEVRALGKQLKRDGCDKHEICVPCYDPRQAKHGLIPTGACDR